MQFPLQFIGLDDKHKNTGFAINKKSLEDYYLHTEKDYTGGYYPIGTNTVWHGGVHLHVPQGNYVHAIAPGMIVAVRLGEEDQALKHYGSANFILVRHTYLSETYYSLFFHLHWEALNDSNSNFKIIDWLKKDDGTIDKRLLNKLKKGKVYSPFKEVKEGDCLWTTGLYGSESSRAPLIHWEIFSEKMLLEGSKQVEDPDDNINCEHKYHEIFLPNFEDMNKDGNLDSGEIVNYFADTDKSKHLRDTACKFISEFAVDWDEAVKKLRRRFTIFRLASRIKPYNFWDEAVGQAARIPLNPHVWHYNPITFIHELNERATVVFIVGTDAPEGDDHAHKSPDNFTKRVDILLKKKTVENLSISKRDSICVVVPRSMPSSKVNMLKEYGKGMSNYVVHQQTPDELRKLINNLTNIRFLIYFGHGVEAAPMYEYAGSYLPQPSELKSSAFKPNARAIFPTCNSKQYAEKFARALTVESVGVEGTTYYGISEISAGKLNDNALPGTSMAWEYTKNEDESINRRSYSISQKRGTAFLEEKK